MRYFARIIASKGGCIKNESGSAVIEFAMTLILLIFIFLAFMQITKIFIAHERLSFATSVASRYFSVHDREAAEIMYTKIEPDAAFNFSAPNVILDKKIDVPIDFYNIIKKGGAQLPIYNKVKTFVEPHPEGDN
ncbi:pilus assembly protein [Desulfococcaceae bacterium HSG7]|nr:pilus assembly protein [Desulfococcaceae bacterium HSG7]